MAFVTVAAIGGLVISGAGLAHTIESSNQARRISGQQKNVAKAVAKKAEDELMAQQLEQQTIEQRDAARANQRRRALSPTSMGIGLGGGEAVPAQPLIGGTGTLIGG